MSPIKWIDLPPVWLLGALGLTWGLRSPRWGPRGGWFDLLSDGLGAVLIACGIGMMVLAVREMQKRRTTVIPHLQPSALVTSGIFQYSRNPIYTGDVMVLSGAILIWAAPMALPLLIIFVLILKMRFILPEEARLRQAFGPSFDRWAQQTRRWL